MDSAAFRIPCRFGFGGVSDSAAFRIRRRRGRGGVETRASLRRYLRLDLRQDVDTWESMGRRSLEYWGLAANYFQGAVQGLFFTCVVGSILGVVGWFLVPVWGSTPKLKRHCTELAVCIILARIDFPIFRKSFGGSRHSRVGKMGASREGYFAARGGLFRAGKSGRKAGREAAGQGAENRPLYARGKSNVFLAHGIANTLAKTTIPQANSV